MTPELRGAERLPLLGEALSTKVDDIVADLLQRTRDSRYVLDDSLGAILLAAAETSTTAEGHGE